MRRSLLQETIDNMRRNIRRGKIEIVTFQIASIIFTAVITIRAVMLQSDTLAKLVTFLSNPIVIGVIATLVASVFMLKYLRTDSYSTERPSYFETLALSRRVASLAETAAGITPEMRKALIGDVQTAATTHLVNDFEHRLIEKYASVLEVYKRAKHVRELADRTLSRLEKEIRALMRRGNLNLVLGTATTVAAVSVLAYVALTTKPTETLGSIMHRRFCSGCRWLYSSRYSPSSSFGYIAPASTT
jgi:hypothetical protein